MESGHLELFPRYVPWVGVSPSCICHPTHACFEGGYQALLEIWAAERQRAVSSQANGSLATWPMKHPSVFLGGSKMDI
jgi:hypothetical protein